LHFGHISIIIYGDMVGEEANALAERVVVLSGKGGTGKSAICAGIASALAEQGRRVLCIDCDVGLRNLDIYLGLSQVGALAFTEIGPGGYALEQAAVHPDFASLSFLTAPVQQDAPVNPDAFAELLEQADSMFDYVLLDAPTGLGPMVSLAAGNAHRAVLVTTGDAASMRDAARTGQELELMGMTDVRLVINRAERRMLRVLGLTADRIMDEIGLPLLGIVPTDPDITLCAAREEALLTRHSRGAAKALRNIALRMEGQSVPLAIHY